MMAHAADPPNMGVSPELDEAELACLVEEICLLGCDTVNAIIAQIKAGQVPEMARQLSAQQLLQLQLELTDIMAPLSR